MLLSALTTLFKGQKVISLTAGQLNILRYLNNFTYSSSTFLVAETEMIDKLCNAIYTSNQFYLDLTNLCLDKLVDIQLVVVGKTSYIKAYKIATQAKDYIETLPLELP